MLHWNNNNLFEVKLVVFNFHFIDKSLNFIIFQLVGQLASSESEYSSKYSTYEPVIAQAHTNLGS